MNPYLTREAYPSKTSMRSKDEPDEGVRSESDDNTVQNFEPKPRDFMFFMGLPQKSRDWFLIRVVEYDKAAGGIVFHYYNNTTNKSRYRLVWTKETPDGHVEKQQQMQLCGFQQRQSAIRVLGRFLLVCRDSQAPVRGR